MCSLHSVSNICDGLEINHREEPETPATKQSRVPIYISLNAPVFARTLLHAARWDSYRCATQIKRDVLGNEKMHGSDATYRLQGESQVYTNALVQICGFYSNGTLLNGVIHSKEAPNILY